MSNSCTAILVLAMHRSGSSLLAGTLAARGVPVGDDLAAADRHNPKGYFESRDINRVLETILQSADSHWHDWRRLSFPAPEKRSRALRALREVVERRFPRAELFAIKDPRSCRLVPLWREALDSLGIRLKLIMGVRHPFEVAMSLNARNGMPIGKGMILWARHVLDALVDSRGLPATIVRYEDVLARGGVELDRIGSALDIHWPAARANSTSQLGELITPALRHHCHADTAISGYANVAWVSELWSLLQNGDAALRETVTVDRLAAEFTRATHPFESYLGAVEAGYDRAIAQIKTLRQELDRAKWRLGEAALLETGSGEDPQKTVKVLAARVVALEAAIRGAR